MPFPSLFHHKTIQQRCAAHAPGNDPFVTREPLRKHKPSSKAQQ